MKKIFFSHFNEKETDSREGKLLGQVHMNRKQESLVSNQDLLIPFFMFCHVIQKETLFTPLSAFGTNVSSSG